MMADNVTYHQQVSYCGKARCRKCREGVGHGPYWYAYRTENGRTIRTYIGKNPPPEVQAQQASVAPPDQARVRVRMLGQFSLERFTRQEWEIVTDSAWQQYRVRALLACLLSSPGRKLGREQVMDILWPEADFETAASRLDRAVYSLRQALEPALSRPALSRLLLTEHDSLVVADQSELWVDADRFEQLLVEAHTTADPGKAEQLLDEAAALYAGDYLPEEREADWAAARRELLQRGWMGLMLELADLRINRTSFVNAIDPLDRLLAIDPANEAAVQRLIFALAHLNRRGEALRAYHRFATALQRDYHIAPLPETRLLYEAIQHEDTRLPETPPFRLLLPGATTPASVQEGIASRPPKQVQIGRSHQSKLIGRDTELEAMRAALQAVEQSARSVPSGKKKPALPSPETRQDTQCLLLVGDAGIGKTRLAEELSHAAQQSGWAVAWSRVYSQESNVPYRQWTEVLRNAMAHGLWQRQEIASKPRVYQPLCALLPELQDLLPRGAAPAPLSPEQEQLRLWEAALQLLSTISERTPLLIVLDDFHWADASSCDLFAYLVRRLRGRSIVIVGTYRDNELPVSHPLRALLTDLHREQAVTTLPIQPLSNEQIAALVAPLPGSFVQYIQQQSAGNPFFAEELARSLESEQIDPRAAESPGAGHPLPDTISAVLELRMSRLSQLCQRLLSNASVLGGSFTFSDISGIEASGNGASEDTVLDLLEEAIQSGALTEEGAGTRITYHFWHPLLVSHLYDQLSAARRTRLHHRAAVMLQRAYQGNEEEGAALITNHLVEGGADAHEIVHYATLAGDHAYNLSAYPAAERFYRLAVTHLDDANAHSAGTGRFIAPSAPADQRAQLAYLLERLGECTRNLGNYEEARHLYQRVLDVREQTLTTTSPGEARIEAQIDALLWREIALTWYDVGDNAHARQCCQRGEDILRAAGVKGGPAWASIRFLQSYIYWREGNYVEARAMAEEALRLFEQAPSLELPTWDATHLTGTQRTLSGDPVNPGRTHLLLGSVANSIGHTANALAHFRDALAIFEQYDRPRNIAIVSCNIGDVYLREADNEPAYAAFRRALYLAERIGETPLKATIYGNFGILAAHSGDLTEAENWFKQGIVLAEQVNHQIFIAILHLYMGMTHEDQGKFDEARKNILTAFTVTHMIRHASLIGFWLIAMNQLRIAQAMHNRNGLSSQERRTQYHSDVFGRSLRKANASLRRALTLGELDAEIRYEGQMALAETFLLLDELDAAWGQASIVCEETRLQELAWITARSESLMARILVARKQWEQANQLFEQVIHVFRQRDMRLELARTLYHYGLALLRREQADKASLRRGLNQLYEARQLFGECGASLDLQLAEREIARYERRKAPR